MPTELDRALDSIMDKLMAPGAPAETIMVERGGVDMPMLKNVPATLVQYFAHFCAEHRDTPFLVDGDCRLSFGESWDAARHVAAGLIARHGVKKGDRVGIAARNSANWIIAYMGIVVAGGCATLLNGFSSGEELAEQLALVDCKLVLADHARAARLEGHAHPAKILPLNHNCDPATGLAVCWADPVDVTLPEIVPADYATVLYTSGSTGKSKGALADHLGVTQGACNFAMQTLMAFTYLSSGGNAPTDQPCALVAVPLFHVTGEIPVFLQSFALGRKMVLMPKWDAGEALRLMDQERVTYFVGVPLMSYELATHPDRDKYDLSACSGFAAGGAPRPPEHVSKLKESFPEGFPLIGYGLTETNAVGCTNLNENYLAKPSSTGKPSRPLVEAAILDDAGNSLPQGQMGEICFRSICNFIGYWNNSDATAAAFTADRFFRTGDLGYLDEDGYVFIVDRKKDIIIRGGENIASIEVEEAIYAHDGVAECSVFGIADARYGEVPAAVVLPKAGKTLALDELREFLLSRIAPFKVPLLGHMRLAPESLPRLGTQKIDKRAVRSAYSAEMTGA